MVKMFQPNRVQQQRSTISTSATGVDNKDAPISPGIAEEVTVLAVYTPTVSSGDISAKKFQNVVDLELGDPNNPFLVVKKGEALDMIQFLSQGVITGEYVDPVPTSGNESVVCLTFRGPFLIPVNSICKASFNAAAEFENLTGFTCTIYVIVKYADNNEIKQVKQIVRQYRASAARHDINVGGNFMTRAYIKCATASRISRLEMKTVLYNGTIQTPVTYIALDQPLAAQAAFAAWSDATTLTGKYLVEGVNAPNYPGRLMTIEMSAADAVTVYSENLISV